MTVKQATDRYTIITADSHCGGSHAQYREYLDPKYHDDFDAWRGKYKNPFKDLRDNRRMRNWDSEVRWQQEESDGVVAEVLFPNTVPPFFPSFVLFARPPKPEEYEHRLAGIRAHNRWLVDFVGECPERRAGIGQIFVNDIDDAIKDLRFIKKNGLRGGALMPTIPPDVTWLKPLYSKAYDKVWAEMQELDIPLNAHGGTGSPNYGKDAVADLLYASEVSFYGQRPFVHLLLSGVFERFPRLKFVMTEMGCMVAGPHPQHGQLVRPSACRPPGRVALQRRPRAAEVGDGVFPAELLGRREPTWSRRCRGARRARYRPVHVGQRLPARRGHLSVHA